MKSWYDSVAKLRHGAPYELDDEGSFLLSPEACEVLHGRGDAKNLKTRAMTTYELDIRASSEVLHKTISLYDRTLSQLRKQQREIRRIGYAVTK